MNLEPGYCNLLSGHGSTGGRQLHPTMPPARTQPPLAAYGQAGRHAARARGGPRHIWLVVSRDLVKSNNYLYLFGVRPDNVERTNPDKRSNVRSACSSNVLMLSAGPIR